MILLDVKFKLKADCLERATAAMRACAAATMKEEGCHAYRFATAFDGEFPIVLFEEWKSQADLDAHFETEHLQHFRNQMAELLESPPVITRYVVSESGPL